MNVRWLMRKHGDRELQYWDGNNWKPVPSAAAVQELDYDEEGMERLVIAIQKLTVKGGLKVQVQPQDILQPWVLQHLPERLR